MKGEVSAARADESISDLSAGSNYSSLRIVVFVAGERSRVQQAIQKVRGMYSTGCFVFVCESAHVPWIDQKSGEEIFVVEQPFNPFGREASVLIEKLRSGVIGACVLMVADKGFESFRFRIFALRLETSCFVLLRADMSALPPETGRWSFGLAAGATLGYRGASQIFSPVTRFLARLLRFAALLKSLTIPRHGLCPGSDLLEDTLIPIAKKLSPHHQRLAVGLAWLANTRMRLTSLRHTKKGKEIVHIIPHVGAGGVQRQLLLLLKNRSHRYNHRVVVIFPGDRFFAPELEGCGVPVYYLTPEIVSNSLAALSDRPVLRSALERVLDIVRTYLPFCREIIDLTLFLRALNPRADIVHCWLIFANLTGSIAARLAGIPWVITSVRSIQSQVEYNYCDPLWQRTLERATVPLATAITANSRAVAMDYQAFAGAKSEKVVTIPNGIEIKGFRLFKAEERASARRALGLTADNLVVGTVARIAKEKDFESFLRAVAVTSGKLPSLRCVIVGEGPLRPYFERLALSLGLMGQVQFLGQRKDVGDIIQCFDVFLLTSILEGMPNAVMESQLLGVPVVATRAGGTVDLISDGETGLLADVGDYRRLADCIEKLFTEPGLRDRISRAAGDQIGRAHAAEAFAARTEELYRTLADRKPERGTFVRRISTG